MPDILEINDVSKLESLRGLWQELVDRDNVRNPFLTLEWIIAWWRYFGKKNKMAVLLIKENKDTVIAPLMVKRTSFLGIPLIKVQFIGTGEANYLDFISTRLSEEALNTVWDYLHKKYKWNIVELTDIVETSPFLEVSKERISDGGFKSVVLESEVCPYVFIQTDWDDYFHSKLKRKSRYNLQRQIKQLQSQGKLEFKRIRQSDDWDNLIRRAVNLYQEDWGRKYNVSSFLKDEFMGFYVDIAKEFSQKGWLDLSCLFLDGEMIAFSYGFTYGDKFIDYLIGYAPEFSKYSAGGCLLKFQLEAIFKQNLREFDFSKGDEPYKSRWKTADRKNYRVLISNKDLYSKWICFFYLVYHRIRYICKRNYTLRNLRKYILGSFKLL